MKMWQVAAAVVALAGCAAVGNGEDKKMTSPLSYTMKDIDGKDYDLSKLKGKVVLFVNVATNCGNTKQYATLQDMFTKYEKDGFVIVGVPANEFGAQEPGTDEEIKKFCTTKYKVSFPMMSKVVVKGEGQVALYKTLVEATPPTRARSSKWAGTSRSSSWAAMARSVAASNRASRPTPTKSSRPSRPNSTRPPRSNW